MALGVDRTDLRALRDEIIEEMRAGFSGVYARQDATNGRVRAGEIQSAEYSIRIKNLERECFPAGGRRENDPSDRPAPVVNHERDVKMIMGTLAAVGATVAFFKMILPLLAKVLAP